MNELFRTFNAASVRYLLIGGQAMRLAGMPRFSMDPRFDEAEKTAVSRKNEHGTEVKCLSGPHLLAAKKSANRPQDQLDIEFLLELQRLGKL